MMPVIDLSMFQVCQVDEPSTSELHEESVPVNALSPSKDGIAGTYSASAGALSFHCHFCGLNSVLHA